MKIWQSVTIATLLGAASMGAQAQVAGTQPLSVTAEDQGLFETLREMGADLTIENLREEGGLVQILDGARPFMLAGLQQIDAVTGTVESDFALLAAALRADAPVDGGTKTLFLAFFADCATHK